MLQFEVVDVATIILSLVGQDGGCFIVAIRGGRCSHHHSLLSGAGRRLFYCCNSEYPGTGPKPLLNAVLVQWFYEQILFCKGTPGDPPLCTGCIQYVYTLYTTRPYGPNQQIVYEVHTYCIHSVYIVAPVVYNMYTICIHIVYNWCASCIQYVYNLYTICRCGSWGRYNPYTICRLARLYTDCIQFVCGAYNMHADCIQIVYNRTFFFLCTGCMR